MFTFDVVIAGGGVAGASVAAALREFGYRILIVEPGLDYSRRLAGELIHPPGVADLTELGLVDAMKRSAGLPVRGFAVLADADERQTFLLRYEETTSLLAEGYSTEHGSLAECLLSDVEKMPGVTVWKGARVVGVKLDGSRAIDVTVRRADGEYRIAPQLLVAADGANSQVRQMAGIRAERKRVSQMTAYAISGVELPHPGYGHIFLAGPGPVLAYQISSMTIRLMFDLPNQMEDAKAPDTLGPYLAALPESFRAHAQFAVENQKPLSAATYSVIPETVKKGRTLCVGDAAGCCHPLSATGLSVCTRDAMRLRDSIRATGGDIVKAINEHSRRRHGPQSTRLELARVLYEAFSARTPEMRVLRKSILRYWERSPRGRAASMALLSLSENRMTRMAREYSHVSWLAFREMWVSGGARGLVDSSGRAMISLSRSTIQYVTAALREKIL